MLGLRAFKDLLEQLGHKVHRASKDHKARLALRDQKAFKDLPESLAHKVRKAFKVFKARSVPQD